MKNHKIIFLVMILVVTVSCNNSSESKSTLDYSQSENWVVQPSSLEKEVDVFYVYPTIYAGKDPQNMDIYDVSLRENAKGLTVAQGGVYSAHANMFAPFYRQETAALQSMDAGNNGVDAFEDPVFQVGANDVISAFDYYIENLNPDRPFILAGHSQGTMALINLMRKRFNNPDLQKRLVAAYLIGYSITKEDLKKYPWMKIAEGKDDTGVIITYNTEGKDAGPSPVLLPGAVAINPLNWKRDNTPADRSKNMGAKFFNDATGEVIEDIPNFAGAHLDLEKGVLIVTDMKTPKSDKINLEHMGRWSKGVFHRYDYAFWYNNLLQNVGDRIESYSK